MEFKEKDFIEIEFTGKTKDGEIFDSNIKEDLKKINPKLDTEPKPLILCLGKGMFLEAIENFLIGKPDTPASYEVELSPEKAFGKRYSDLIQIVPMKIFQKNNINPIPKTMFNLDGRIAKILTVSGGRVVVDFNNPLAGKDVIYRIKVLRKVEDINEKIKALISFFFKREIEFELKDKKLILKIEKPMIEYAKLFKETFKDILDLELEIQEVEKVKEEKKEKEEIKENKK